MFFKYNRLTQGLNAATQDAAFGRPVTPEAFNVAIHESPKIQYDYKPLKPAEVKHVSSSHPEAGVYPVPNNKEYKRLMEKQIQFLANDGRLVWQKFAPDRAFYGVLVGMTVVGATWMLYGIKRLIVPPKDV